MSRAAEVADRILSQIDHMRPDHLIPGRHVGARRIDGGVEVTLPEYGRSSRITYDEGNDLYSVEVTARDQETGQVTQNGYVGVYCDQLGEMVWGKDSKPWTQPFGQIIDTNTGEVRVEW